MNERWIEEYKILPKAGSHRLIDFERAEVWGVDSNPPRDFVAVSGRKPYANMWVDLAPLACFGRPEYWGIEVVGRLPVGIGLPSKGLPSEEARYNLSIPLYGITGTKGIEIIGATRSECIEVPHEQTPGECSKWYAWRDLEPVGPVSLRVIGECEFPDESYHAELELIRREPQGINPKDLLLELIVRARGSGEKKETTLEVRYEEQTDFEYETVTILNILPAGVTVPVVDAR